jgi:hypothetical protein
MHNEFPSLLIASTTDIEASTWIFGAATIESTYADYKVRMELVENQISKGAIERENPLLLDDIGHLFTVGVGRVVDSPETLGSYFRGFIYSLSLYA